MISGGARHSPLQSSRHSNFSSSSFPSSSLLPIEQPADDLPLVYRILFFTRRPAQPVARTASDQTGAPVGVGWGGRCANREERLRASSATSHQNVEGPRWWGGGTGRVEQFQPGWFVTEPRRGTGRWHPDRTNAAAECFCSSFFFFFPNLFFPRIGEERRWIRAACSECERWSSSLHRRWRVRGVERERSGWGRGRRRIRLEEWTRLWWSARSRPSRVDW